MIKVRFFDEFLSNFKVVPHLNEDTFSQYGKLNLFESDVSARQFELFSAM